MNNSNTNIDWNTLQRQNIDWNTLQRQRQNIDWNTNLDWNNTFTNLLPCELEIEKLKKKNLEILETQKKIENILEYKTGPETKFAN